MIYNVHIQYFKNIMGRVATSSIYGLFIYMYCFQNLSIAEK